MLTTKLLWTSTNSGIPIFKYMKSVSLIAQNGISYITFFVINYEHKNKAELGESQIPEKQVESWFVNKSRAATLFS